MSRPAPEHVTAVLLAGGRGRRAEGPVPKQFLDLAGHPMVVHSLLAFESSPRIASVVVILPRERPEGIDGAVALPKVAAVAAGGASRKDSLVQGMACLPEETTVVLVHDAARPLVSPSLVDRVLDGLDDDFGGALAAVPLDDALKEAAASGEVLRSRSRAGLWRAQTPQAFRRSCLEDALARADAEGYVGDDCSELAVRAGYRVRVVPGDPFNIKATRARDLMLCERILAARAESRALGRLPG